MNTQISQDITHNVSQERMESALHCKFYDLAIGSVFAKHLIDDPDLHNLKTGKTSYLTIGRDQVVSKHRCKPSMNVCSVPKVIMTLHTHLLEPAEVIMTRRAVKAAKAHKKTQEAAKEMRKEEEARRAKLDKALAKVTKKSAKRSDKIEAKNQKKLDKAVKRWEKKNNALNALRTPEA